MSGVAGDDDNELMPLSERLHAQARKRGADVGSMAGDVGGASSVGDSDGESAASASAAVEVIDLTESPRPHSCTGKPVSRERDQKRRRRGAGVQAAAAAEARATTVTAHSVEEDEAVTQTPAKQKRGGHAKKGKAAAAQPRYIMPKELQTDGFSVVPAAYGDVPEKAITRRCWVDPPTAGH